MRELLLSGVRVGFRGEAGSCRIEQTAAAEGARPKITNQRFGSALNLNPHFHVLMPDGVFFAGPGGTPVFVPAPALTDDDVRRIAETTAHRVVDSALQCLLR